MTRLWIILSTLAIVVGVSCLFYSFFLDPGSLVFTITLALGISFLPTGLISIITAVSSNYIIESNLRSKLDQSTYDLKSSIYDLQITSTFFNRSKEIGLVMVYENRRQALESFLTYLEDYVRREANGESDEIVFVGSSLAGVIVDDPKYETQLERIINCCKNKDRFRFLLTHPTFAEFREAQEDRPVGGIAKEILHALAWLEEKGIPSDSIKVYKGTPTVFMIASSEKMLLNPYPYEREAYRSFCIEVENIKGENSIFYSFFTNHYFKPFHGDQDRKDHFLVPNTLDCDHHNLDGPFPPRKSQDVGDFDLFADYFIIKDSGSFYLAVNIRGLESKIPCSRNPDGSRDFIKVGDELRIKLLDTSEKESIWETVGSLRLTNSRFGFWHGTISNKSHSNLRHVRNF